MILREKDNELISPSSDTVQIQPSCYNHARTASLTCSPLRSLSCVVWRAQGMSEPEPPAEAALGHDRDGARRLPKLALHAVGQDRHGRAHVGNEEAAEERFVSSERGTCHRVTCHALLVFESHFARQHCMGVSSKYCRSCVSCIFR